MFILLAGSSKLYENSMKSRGVVKDDVEVAVYLLPYLLVDNLTLNSNDTYAIIKGELLAPLEAAVTGKHPSGLSEIIMSAQVTFNFLLTIKESLPSCRLDINLARETEKPIKSHESWKENRNG